MMLALDEYNLGGVTPGSLDRLVEEMGSIEELVDAFIDDDEDGKSPFLPNIIGY
jgi:hypothetical protein